MLVSYGGVAASRFRLNRLLQRLRAVVSELSQVSARHIHLLHCVRDLDAEEERVLESLVDYGAPAEDCSASTHIYVLPRFGSISPLSSKATDVLRNAGLIAVRRVERAIFRIWTIRWHVDAAQREELARLLHDRMTQSVVFDLKQAEHLFDQAEPAKLTRIDLGDDASEALRNADRALGLALSEDEITYLAEHYAELGRDPSDVELMMFAQANSEHRRHKIFNARWDVEGVT